MPDLEDPQALRRAEDVALLARIVERDERAVEALYARYSGPLYSLAYQVTGAERFAQDVVQEVFVALWRDAWRFDPARGAVGPWLFSLARHKAIDLVRREANVRKRTADVDLELEEAADDVDGEAWARIRRSARPHRDRGADARPARGARAGVLPGAHACRGVRAARHPAGHGQDPDPERAAAPARHPRRLRVGPPGRFGALGSGRHMTHGQARRLAAGSVLEDLAPLERARYARHRAGCADCRRLEVELDAVMAELSLAAPNRVPPPALLDGIRAAIRADAVGADADRA